MFCKKCGKEISANSKYCGQCGNHINVRDKHRAEANTSFDGDEDEISDNKDSLPRTSPFCNNSQHEIKHYFSQWFGSKKGQLINKYKEITPKQRNVFLSLLLILMLSIGVGVYIAVPKYQMLII